jgi:hypothetical protein
MLRYLLEVQYIQQDYSHCRLQSQVESTGRLSTAIRAYIALAWLTKTEDRRFRCRVKIYFEWNLVREQFNFAFGSPFRVESGRLLKAIVGFLTVAALKEEFSQAPICQGTIMKNSSMACKANRGLVVMNGAHMQRLV